jgi:hypothetical protein
MEEVDENSFKRSIKVRMAEEKPTLVNPTKTKQTIWFWSLTNK